MTARIVISCDAAWNGMPCRGALPTRASGIDRARLLAESYGWRCSPGRDLCPAHARLDEAIDRAERSGGR